MFSGRLSHTRESVVRVTMGSEEITEKSLTDSNRNWRMSTETCKILFSALELLNDYVLYKSTYSLTHNGLRFCACGILCTAVSGIPQM